MVVTLVGSHASTGPSTPYTKLPETPPQKPPNIFKHVRVAAPWKLTHFAYRLTQCLFVRLIVGGNGVNLLGLRGLVERVGTVRGNFSRSDAAPDPKTLGTILRNKYSSPYNGEPFRAPLKPSV